MSLNAVDEQLRAQAVGSMGLAARVDAVEVSTMNDMAGLQNLVMALTKEVMALRRDMNRVLQPEPEPELAPEGD